MNFVFGGKQKVTNPTIAMLDPFPAFAASVAGRLLAAISIDQPITDTLDGS